MEMSTEELKEKLTKLEQDYATLQEAYQSSLQKLQYMAHLDFLWDALEKPNPKLAVDMIHKYNKDIYLYACKSLESKKQLLMEALATNDPIVVITVVCFLSSTLNEDLFSAIVMSNELVAKLFLQYLLATDYEEFERYCLKYNKYRAYAEAKFQRALNIIDNEERIKALVSCLELCRDHSQELGWLIAAIEQNLTCT